MLFKEGLRLLFFWWTLPFRPQEGKKWGKEDTFVAIIFIITGIAYILPVLLLFIKGVPE